MRRLKIGTNEKDIVEYIGLGLVAMAALTSPNLPRILLPILKKRGQKGFKQLLKQLEEKRVVNLSGEKIKLTARGRNLLDEIYLSKFDFEASDNWDGKWRLVSYDVPEKYKKSRNLFRKVLENNGFYFIHKSLWVLPYECKEEIAILAKNLGLSKNVIVMITEHLPNQQEMMNHFDLEPKK